MLGYEGYATIGGVAVLVTAAGTSINRNRLDSSGVYGASYLNAIGAPHIYDYPIFEGNISFEVHSGIVPFLKERINDRKVPFSFHLYTGAEGYQFIENSYWTSLSVGASTDSPVVCTLAFTATLRNSYKLSSGYFGNNYGVMPLLEFQSTDELNTADNTSPYPFWSTTISGLSEVATWSIGLTQSFLPIFGCFGIDGQDPANPIALGIGVLNGQFDYTCYNLLKDEDYSNGYIGEDSTDIINNFGFTNGVPTDKRKSFTIKLRDDTPLYTISGEPIDPKNGLASISSITTTERSYQLYSIQTA
jgi:hypothetical protein